MDQKIKQEIEQTIVTVEDFPIKGISFKDITPLFKKPQLINAIIDDLAKKYANEKIDVILGAESRGFLFGLPLALKMNLPFVMARKPGKLPGSIITRNFVLEYGQSNFSMQTDSIKPGQRVLIVDDLLATGGTVNCLELLVDDLKGIVVGSAYLIELKDLKGRDRLKGDVYSIIEF